MDSRINALMRQNQELKMELTELRNAFDLNREVLYVLSTKAEPTKRHFYIMLKKMNEHILDLAENQFKTRKDRVNKIEECNLLQAKYQKSLQEIENLNKEIHSLRQQISKLMQNQTVIKSVEDKSKSNSFTPKELHIILTEEIRKISNELFIMGNLATKYKHQNIKLKKYVQNVQDGLSGRNSRIGSSRNLDQTCSPKASFFRRATLYEIWKNEREEEEEMQEIELGYNSGDQQEDLEPGTFKQLNSFTTMRFGNFTHGHNFRTKQEMKKQINLPKQIKQYEQRQRLLDLKLKKSLQEQEIIKKENEQLNRRLQLLINCQNTILNRLAPNRNIPNRQEQIVSIIQLVQWRYKLKYLDSEECLKINQKLMIKSKSVFF